jgi:hypothetical protein
MDEYDTLRCPSCGSAETRITADFAVGQFWPGYATCCYCGCQFRFTFTETGSKQNEDL